jgi:hypothetical protein
VPFEARVTAPRHERVPFGSPSAPNSPQSPDSGRAAQPVVLALRVGFMGLFLWAGFVRLDLPVGFVVLAPR